MKNESKLHKYFTEEWDSTCLYYTGYYLLVTGAWKDKDGATHLEVAPEAWSKPQAELLSYHLARKIIPIIPESLPNIPPLNK